MKKSHIDDLYCMLDLKLIVDEKHLEKTAIQDLLDDKEEIYTMAKVCREYTEEKESLVANLVMFAAYCLRKEEIVRNLETNPKFANRRNN